MPGMPRPEGKAKKIAYAILGVPDNIAAKRSTKQKKQDQSLVFQETVRVR